LILALQTMGLLHCALILPLLELAAFKRIDREFIEKDKQGELMDASEPNKDKERLIANKRMEKAPQSGPAAALKVCSLFFASGAVLLGAVLISFGWMKVGIVVAVMVLILSAAVFAISGQFEVRDRTMKRARQEERDVKARKTPINLPPLEETSKV
jgi:uncharacterized membrane protein